MGTFSPDAIFKDTLGKFPDAVVGVEIGDGKRIEVVYPVKGSNFNNEIEVGGYKPCGEFVLALIGKEMYGFDVVDSGDNAGKLDIENGTDWKDIVRQIENKRTREDGIVPGKFTVSFSSPESNMNLSGTTAIKLELDENMKLSGFVELMAKADEAGKEKKASQKVVTS